MMSEPRTLGLVLGKFLPPHTGHVYLVDFARHYADDVVVVVETEPNQPIPGRLRFEWMRQMFPQLQVIHLQDSNPQEPSEHPNFWSIWKASLERVLPREPNFIFASEPYGQPLAETLGGTFVPVDIGRGNIQISGTAVRNGPLANWSFLPPITRSWFAKRISVFGPESTGKSTLAAQLASHYETTLVPEYARAHLERKGGNVAMSDMPIISRGQAASEEALVRNANRVLICDTDPLATVIWSDRLFGCCDPDVRETAIRHYDLTLLCDVDVPWVADSVRYLPEDRRGFFDACRHELETNERRTVTLSGSWDERFALAKVTIDTLIATDELPKRPITDGDF